MKLLVFSSGLSALNVCSEFSGVYVSIPFLQFLSKGKILGVGFPLFYTVSFLHQSAQVVEISVSLENHFIYPIIDEMTS